MHETNRVANLLGATALAVTDLALGGASRTAGVSSTGAAALVSLAAHPGMNVTELGRRVGLSQSAAARMVDSLEADGLVERRPSSASSRLTLVHPTDPGRETAHRIIEARTRPLAELVGELAPPDQRRLGALLGRLLDGLYDQIGHGQYMCRMCDRDSCQAEAPCPVGEAEQRRPRARKPAARRRLETMRRDRRPPAAYFRPR